MDVIGSVTGRFYQAGPVLARAGEGAVYRVVGDASILIKIFDAPPSAPSIRKLELLSCWAHKPAFTALPFETVVDLANRTVVGFVQPFYSRTVSVTSLFDAAGRRAARLPTGVPFSVKV